MARSHVKGPSTSPLRSSAGLTTSRIFWSAGSIACWCSPARRRRCSAYTGRGGGPPSPARTRIPPDPPRAAQWSSRPRRATGPAPPGSFARAPHAASRGVHGHAVGRPAGAQAKRAAARRPLRLEADDERPGGCRLDGQARRDVARLTDRVLADHERQPVRVRLDDDALGLPAGDRLLARVPEERGEGRHLRPYPDGVGALADRRDDDADGDRDDEQRDEELEEREAARRYCCALWSHDVMSALSPSPPG